MLGVVFLMVILIDLSPLPLTPREQGTIRAAELVMYLLFVLEFVTRWWIAEDKRRFIKRNWFNLVVLLLPMLRPLMLARSVPALASSSGLTGIAGSHRGLAGLRELTRGRQLAYVVSLTVVIVLLATGSVFYLEHTVPGSPFTTFSETIWWAATLVTTINNDDDPVTGPGRIIALLVRIYAVSVFGYITASIATWFIGRNATPAVTGSDAGTGSAPSPGT